MHAACQIAVRSRWGIILQSWLTALPQMPTFTDWLRRLLETGESVQQAPPPAPVPSEVTATLRDAFRLHSLDLAGPAVPFDAETALRAAVVLADSCWRLVGSAPADPTPDRLGRPQSPSTHLSADVTLRFLPAVYCRARPRGDDDPLARWIEGVLRRWPLSGVLAGLPGGPEVSPDFGGHPGLALLYAERLVERPVAAWVPPAGLNREWVDRVFAQRGRPVPAPALEVPA